VSFTLVKFDHCVVRSIALALCCFSLLSGEARAAASLFKLDQAATAYLYITHHAQCLKNNIYGRVGVALTRDKKKEKRGKMEDLRKRDRDRERRINYSKHTVNHYINKNLQTYTTCCLILEPKLSCACMAWFISNIYSMGVTCKISNVFTC
jgi:hypothetical protein